MPSGVYSHPPQCGFQKGHKIWLGKKHTKETKEKNRQAHRGSIPWNKGKKGLQVAWNKGKKCPQISKSCKGRKSWNKGKKLLGLIGKWKRKHTEETKRKIGEAMTKEKNPNWKGGISFEPYGLEFNEDLKEVIRNRDRRKCMLCGKTELENGKKLVVHHIDYCKTNNDPKNLISLCKECHLKTNYNRNYWINYFKNLIKNK